MRWLQPLQLHSWPWQATNSALEFSVFCPGRVGCCLLHYTTQSGTKWNRFERSLKNENHNRKIKFNQKIWGFPPIIYQKKAFSIDLEVPLLVITGILSILHISKYCLAVHRVLAEKHMVHSGQFFPLLESHSAALASKHFKDQQKSWESIFCVGPIRVTLQLPTSFYSLTCHSCQEFGNVGSFKSIPDCLKTTHTICSRLYYSLQEGLSVSCSLCPLNKGPSQLNPI